MVESCCWLANTRFSMFVLLLSTISANRMIHFQPNTKYNSAPLALPQSKNPWNDKNVSPELLLSSLSFLLTLCTSSLLCLVSLSQLEKFVKPFLHPDDEVNPHNVSHAFGRLQQIKYYQVLTLFTSFLLFLLIRSVCLRCSMHMRKHVR